MSLINKVMNTRKFRVVLITVAITAFLFYPVANQDIAAPDNQADNKISGSGTAIIMTGAAARIPQQTALLEELYNRGSMKDVVFISGVSAGALNAVMLNGILSGKITWDEYKKMLFSLENKDIFLYPERRKLPVNTESLRILLKKIVEDRLGYYRIGDLPFMTEISFTSRLRKNVYRMCSRKINAETDTTLSLVDIMMASTAIPVAFPSVRIENAKTIPNVRFIDGGVGSDYIPFRALLDFQKHRGEKVRRVYIVGRKQGNFAEIDEELKVLGFDNKRDLDRIGSAFDNLLKRHLLNRLEAYAEEAPDMINKSYVWIPDFEQDFLMFNFSRMEEQYTITQSWAQVNDPVPLGDFLLNNKVKR
jgi:hypothetical protein